MVALASDVANLPSTLLALLGIVFSFTEGLWRSAKSVYGKWRACTRNCVLFTLPFQASVIEV